MLYRFFINSIFNKSIKLLDKSLFGGGYLSSAFMTGAGQLLWTGMRLLFASDTEEEIVKESDEQEDLVNPRIVYGSRWVETQLLLMTAAGKYLGREIVAVFLICNNTISGIEPEIMVGFGKRVIKINTKTDDINSEKIIRSKSNKLTGKLESVGVCTGSSDVFKQFPHLDYMELGYSFSDYLSKSPENDQCSFLVCKISLSQSYDKLDADDLMFPKIAVKTVNSILFDPRSDKYVESNNTALCLYHFLLNVLSIPVTMVDIDSVIHAANICDTRTERINDERCDLHVCNAVIALEDDPTNHISYLLHNMLGDLYMEDGKLRIRAGSVYKVLNYAHVITKNICDDGVGFDTIAEDTVESSFVVHTSYVNDENKVIKLPPLLVDLRTLSIPVAGVSFYSKSFESDKNNVYKANNTDESPDMRTSSYNLDKYRVDLSGAMLWERQWFKPKIRNLDVLHFYLSLPFVSNENQARMLTYYYARMLIFKKYKFRIDLSVDEHKFTFDYAYKIRLPFFTYAYNFIVESREFDIEKQSVRLILRLDHESIWSDFKGKQIKNLMENQNKQRPIRLRDLFSQEEYVVVLKILLLNQESDKSVYNYKDYFYYEDTVATEEKGLSPHDKGIIDKEFEEIRQYINKKIETTED